jgi:protein-tyrosine-phosphatase
LNACNVLFICEHGSAKSVIAAAHFERIARDRGLNARAMSRGTDPDDEYPPHVLAGLAGDGLAPLDDHPVRLSVNDLEDATHVVAFCSTDSLPPTTEAWHDVAPVSEGYIRAREEIVIRVERLLNSI